MALVDPSNSNVPRSYPSLSIWQNTKLSRMKKVVALPFPSLRRGKKSAFGKPRRKMAHPPPAGNARSLPVILTGIATENANANESETGTESAIVTRTATRDGTMSAIGIAVIESVIATGTGMLVDTITVWTIMIRTPATMDIWIGIKIVTETIGLPSTLVTSEMGEMTDVGLGATRETTGMGVDSMKRHPMETKMKTGTRVGKNVNEVKM